MKLNIYILLVSFFFSVNSQAFSISFGDYDVNHSSISTSISLDSALGQKLKKIFDLSESVEDHAKGKGIFEDVDGSKRELIVVRESRENIELLIVLSGDDRTKVTMRANSEQDVVSFKGERAVLLRGLLEGFSGNTELISVVNTANRDTVSILDSSELGKKGNYIGCSRDLCTIKFINE